MCRAVEAVCHEGTAAVLELAHLGAQFTKARTGGFHLTKEGGHSQNRIVHAADATGAEIERALLAQVSQHPNITVHEHYLATDLLTDEVSLSCCSSIFLQAASSVQQSTPDINAGVSHEGLHAKRPA